MDSETKRYRKLRQELANQKPFRSRAALRSDKRRNTKIFNFKRAQIHKRSGLGALDRAGEALIDKYYIREHFPPRDVMTELMTQLEGFSDTSNLSKLVIIALVGVLAFKAWNM